MWWMWCAGTALGGAQAPTLPEVASPPVSVVLSAERQRRAPPDEPTQRLRLARREIAWGAAGTLLGPALVGGGVLVTFAAGYAGVGTAATAGLVVTATGVVGTIGGPIALLVGSQRARRVAVDAGGQPVGFPPIMTAVLLVTGATMAVAGAIEADQSETLLWTGISIYGGAAVVGTISGFADAHHAGRVRLQTSLWIGPDGTLGLVAGARF